MHLGKCELQLDPNSHCISAAWRSSSADPRATSEVRDAVTSRPSIRQGFKQHSLQLNYWVGLSRWRRTQAGKWQGMSHIWGGYTMLMQHFSLCDSLLLIGSSKDDSIIDRLLSLTPAFKLNLLFLSTTGTISNVVMLFGYYIPNLIFALFVFVEHMR